MKEYFNISDMSKEEFRRLQLKVLDTLLYFDAFCKEHHLRYYLAGGTLIGALRGGGFIPWDEDIDVHMPRPDYEKLPKLWNIFFYISLFYKSSVIIHYTGSMMIKIFFIIF